MDDARRQGDEEMEEDKKCRDCDSENIKSTRCQQRSSEITILMVVCISIVVVSDAADG